MTDQTVPQTQATPARPAPSKSDFTAEMSLVRTVKHLWPYVWPADRMDLKFRACLALSMMLIAKLVTLAVPFAFKWVTDSLSTNGAPEFEWWMLGGPIALTVV